MNAVFLSILIFDMWEVDFVNARQASNNDRMNALHDHSLSTRHLERISSASGQHWRYDEIFSVTESIRNIPTLEKFHFQDLSLLLFLKKPALNRIKREQAGITSLGLQSRY